MTRPYSMDLRERVVAAVLTEGMTRHQAAARFNGQVFLAWVRQSLVPSLKPGQIVIMDNLGSHRGKAVRRAI